MKKSFFVLGFLAAFGYFFILKAQQPPQTERSCDPPCSEDSICQDGSCVFVDPSRDDDQDGFPRTADCNDMDPTINPNAQETCDGIDNNCDGTPDDPATCRCLLPAQIAFPVLLPAQQPGATRSCRAGLHLLPAAERARAREEADRKCTQDFSNEGNPILYCSTGGGCFGVNQRQCRTNEDCQHLIDNYGWTGNLRPECTAAGICKCQGASCVRCVACALQRNVVPARIDNARAAGIVPIPCRAGLQGNDLLAADVHCTYNVSNGFASYCGTAGRCEALESFGCHRDADCLRLQNEFNVVGITGTCNQTINICNCNEETGGCLRCVFPDVEAQIVAAPAPQPVQPVGEEQADDGGQPAGEAEAQSSGGCGRQRS